MMAEAGLAALWIAAALSLLQLCAGVSASLGEGQVLRPMIRPVAIAQGALAALSFLLLIQLFLATDLSVKLVAANSHSAKPWLYKFAGTEGEGLAEGLLTRYLVRSGAFVAAA